MAPTLIRDVIERNASSSSALPHLAFSVGPGDSSATGFPTVQHRSRVTSAFKRARLDQRTQTGQSASRERVSDSLRTHVASGKASGTNTVSKDFMEDISRLNAQALENMSEEERQQGREEIIDHFGSDVKELMKKVRQARERRKFHQATVGQQPKHDRSTSSDGLHIEKSNDPTQCDSNSITEHKSSPPSPRSRSTRKIRFVDPTDADVFVYESQPSSPKRTLALLPPPPEDPSEKIGVSSLGSLGGSCAPQNPAGQPSPTTIDDIIVAHSPDEGTPEDIRRRFFPSEMPPEDNPALAWMLPPSTSQTKSPIGPEIGDSPEKQSVDDTPANARYSLSGVKLLPSQINNLPTHLGLHHHASKEATFSSNAPAGYTLADLLLLARSSVPAQRAGILGVLAKILRISREEVYGHGSNLSRSECVDLDAMRKDVLDAAINALGEKGGVGQRAVDVLWEAVVGFIQAEFDIADLADLPRIDLTLPALPSSPSPSSLYPRPSAKPPSHAVAVIEALPLGRILPALHTHLSNSLLPSLTHSEVLEILLVLSHFPQHARTIVDSDDGAGVIGAMLGLHVSSFDPDAEVEIRGTLTSIYILQALARTGRDVAAMLIGPADVLLRYIMTPLPPADSTQILSDRNHLGLIGETLNLYALLAQYGMYSHAATIGQEHINGLGAWLLRYLHLDISPKVTSLARAYLGLIEVWIICATNPHKTTPSHDILWSQIRGMGWAEWTLELADLLANWPSQSAPFGSDRHTPEARECQGLWTSLCCTLLAWVNGAIVNGVKSGEEEKMLILTRFAPLSKIGHPMELAIRATVKDLQDWRFPTSPIAQPADSFRMLSDAASLLAAAMKLGPTCYMPDTSVPLELLGAQDIHDVCVSLLKNDRTKQFFHLVANSCDTPKVPEDTHNVVRSVSSLLVTELQLWHRSITLATSDNATGATTAMEEWINHALRVLCALLPGDEHHAGWIFQTLCDIGPSFIQKVLPSLNLPNEQWEKDGLKILFPFLTYSLRSTPVYIAPVLPSPESIASCTTLVSPSLFRLRNGYASYNRDFVLPIRSDWPFWPLNHLLRSSSSPVFQRLPLSWDATEVDVVRASLLLARLVSGLDIDHSLKMSRPEAVFACMRIFMLEHGQQQLDSGEEVFRDSWVTRWMDDLLAPFAYGKSRIGNTSRLAIGHDSSLELVSQAFLGKETPFFQFYADFLALYDAISFSHPLFGRLLFPPVSMAYAIDYRKLLFGDYGHTLRTIKIDVDDVLCEDVQEYLWPLEQDARMIGWYMKTLFTSPVYGFVRWIAIHHVASNIWQNFREENKNLERAKRLLSAVTTQGSVEIVKDIVSYRQIEDEVWVPPKCYEQGDDVWKAQRLDFVELLGGRQTREGLQRLLV